MPYALCPYAPKPLLPNFLAHFARELAYGATTFFAANCNFLVAADTYFLETTLRDRPGPARGMQRQVDEKETRERERRPR